jgi:hypothetical protein
MQNGLMIALSRASSALIVLLLAFLLDPYFFVILYTAILLPHYYSAARVGWFRFGVTRKDKAIFIATLVGLALLCLSLYLLYSPSIVFVFGVHFIFSEVYADPYSKHEASFERGARLILHAAVYASLLSQWFIWYPRETWMLFASIAYAFVLLIRLNQKTLQWHSVAMDTIPFVMALVVLFLNLEIGLLHVVFYHILWWLILSLKNKTKALVKEQVIGFCLVIVPVIIVHFVFLTTYPGKYVWSFLQQIGELGGFFHIIVGTCFTTLQPRLMNRFLVQSGH